LKTTFILKAVKKLSHRALSQHVFTPIDAYTGSILSFEFTKSVFTSRLSVM